MVLVVSFGFSFLLVSHFFWFWVGVLLPLLFGFPFSTATEKVVPLFFLGQALEEKLQLKELHSLPSHSLP